LAISYPIRVIDVFVDELDLGSLSLIPLYIGTMEISHAGMYNRGVILFSNTPDNDYPRSAMADIFLNMLKLLTKWKPDWLYDAMPYIYLVAGLATIFHFGTPAGYGAGALLLIATLLIWIMRKENRSFKNKLR